MTRPAVLTTTPAAAAVPLSVLRAGQLPRLGNQQPWLVRDIWSSVAVGFIGGQPKCAKTWLALDIAISVASGTPCLGQFPVAEPGPVLAYLAEDALPRVRERVDALCAHRHLALDALDLHLVDAPVLRLDDADDRARLSEAVARLGPRLLILDPLVRLHALDENSSAEISALLGWLRALSREQHLAIIVVHHMSKKSRSNTLEHRSAQARQPLPLKLVTGPDAAVHLEPVLDTVVNDASSSVTSLPLDERVLAALRAATAPLSRVALRNLLHVNNLKLGDVLTKLDGAGRIARTDGGWVVAPAPPA